MTIYSFSNYLYLFKSLGTPKASIRLSRSNKIKRNKQQQPIYMFCLQARERKGRSILLPFYLSSLQFNGAAFKKCKQPFFICDLTRNENV